MINLILWKACRVPLHGNWTTGLAHFEGIDTQNSWLQGVQYQSPAKNTSAIEIVFLVLGMNIGQGPPVIKHDWVKNLNLHRELVRICKRGQSVVIFVYRKGQWIVSDFYPLTYRIEKWDIDVPVTTHSLAVA